MMNIRGKNINYYLCVLVFLSIDVKITNVFTKQGPIISLYTQILYICLDQYHWNVDVHIKIHLV